MANSDLQNLFDAAPNTSTPTPDAAPVIPPPASILGNIAHGSDLEKQFDAAPYSHPGIMSMPNPTQDQAAAHRGAMSNYVKGFGQGASKFGQMITNGTDPNSNPQTTDPTSLTFPETVSPISLGDVGHIAKNIPGAANYLVNATVANIPLTAQVGAVGDTVGDLWNGIHSKGIANLGNDKNGNPIPLAQDWNKHVNDINAQNTLEAAQTSPQFYNTMGSLASSKIPLSILEKIGEGPNLTNKVIGGSAILGSYGAAQGASDTPDWFNNPDQLAKNTLYGGVTGIGIGGLTPLVSSAASGLYNKLAESTFSPTKLGDLPTEARDKILGAMKGPESDDVLTQRLQQQGPEGTLADVTPGLAHLARGTATAGVGEEPQNIIHGNLNERAATMPARVAGGVDSALGPMTDTQREIARGLTQGTKDIGENELLPSVKAGPSIDTKPLVDFIDSRLPVAVGGEKAALQNIRNDLVTPGTPPVVTPPTKSPGGSFTVRTPTTPAVPASTMISAEKLNEVRKKISDMTTWGAPDIDIPSGAQVRKIGSLKYLGGQTRQMLGDQVPGFNTAMDKISPLMEQREALNYGADALHDQGSGVDFAHDFAQYGRPPGWKLGDPEWQPGNPLTDSQKAVQLGMRYGIDKGLGTTKNDAVGLRNLLQDHIPPSGTITPGPGEPALAGQGYNSQKIETAFGPNARSQLQTLANNEGTFARTHTTAVGGSNTDINQAIQKSAAEMVPETKPFIKGDDFKGATAFGSSVVSPLVGTINRTVASLTPPIDPSKYLVPAANALVGNKGLDAQNLFAQALRLRDNLASNKAASDSIRRTLTYALGRGTIPTTSYIGKTNQ